MQSSSLDNKSRTPEGYILFGSISGVFGVHGEVKFFLHNPNTSLLNCWVSVQLLSEGDIQGPIEIKARKSSGKKIVGKVRVDGVVVSTPEEARTYMQRDILISKETLPTLDDEEFYHHDLLGLPVKYNDGELVGTVVEITPGTVDVFTIQTVSRQMLYVPFIAQQVLSVSSTEIVVQRYEES